MLSSNLLDEIKRVVGIRVSLEGPSHWIVRGLIEDIDDYVVGCITMLLDEYLPDDIEYDVLEDKTLCDIDSSAKDCRDTLLIALYYRDDEKPFTYIVFNRRLGDNTYSLEFREVIQTS